MDQAEAAPESTDETIERDTQDGEPTGTVVPFRRRSDEPATEPIETPRLRDVVGEVLRDERQRQERTLTDVARGAAVSVPYLSEVERGRKEVSSDVLDAITRALGLELADVLERAARQLRPGTQGDLRVQLRAAA